MEEPLLTVAAMARRLGVAPATLRTWDRRYGLGPGAHTTGSHRRYSPADVARLESMRRLTVQGVPPAHAARLARQASAAPGTGIGQGPSDPPAGQLPPRGSGGRVLALPAAGAGVRGLARAAMALDASAMTEQLTAAIAAAGVVATWETLLRPVLVAIGERWEATGDGVDVEHLLSQCTSGALGRHAGSLTAAANLRPVLLTCVAGELHTLPLDALAAALAERRIATHVLGAAVPVRAMRSAVRRIGPAALFVWSQLPATGDPAQLAAVPATRPAVTVIAGGPGWPEARLPPRVRFAADLLAAVALIERAATG
ncbi:MAG: MerR family transcriptional regulator [Mycobacteriales bacterium]